jgi:hypothetical protein
VKKSDKFLRGKKKAHYNEKFIREKMRENLKKIQEICFKMKKVIFMAFTQEKAALFLSIFKHFSFF